MYVTQNWSPYLLSLTPGAVCVGDRRRETTTLLMDFPIPEVRFVSGCPDAPPHWWIRVTQQWKDWGHNSTMPPSSASPALRWTRKQSTSPGLLFLDKGEREGVLKERVEIFESKRAEIFESKSTAKDWSRRHFHQAKKEGAKVWCGHRPQKHNCDCILYFRRLISSSVICYK